MGEIAKLAKMICIVVVVFSLVSLFGVLIPDDSTNDSSPAATHISTPTPASTPTPEPVESSIVERVVVRRSHQDITVECKHLRVDTDNNVIQIANSDVESIRILGHGNSVGYSCDANPRIDDFGNYNDVWQRWLT